MDFLGGKRYMICITVLVSLSKPDLHKFESSYLGYCVKSVFFLLPLIVG
jgi:hypothetical protein